jgi:K+-transporting ATPase KdpF subunit
MALYESLRKTIAMDIIIGIVAVALVIYLFITMVRPEDF